MEFNKVVCWNKDLVYKVMDPDALQVANDIFLATHHPVKMMRESLISGASKSEYNENELLRDVLNHPDYVFVTVLGSSGTGKSHLVRWLYAKISQTDKRQVLLIPKAGTNLREIIRLILKGMKGKKFDDYRHRLDQATASLREGEAREMLLDNLAQVVGVHGPHGCNNLSDEEIYLAEELPNLLRDPFFRKHLLKDNGIIHRLTIHILGDHYRVERIEDRRGFSVEDLPLDERNLQRNLQQASKAAQEVYTFLLGDPDIQTIAVDWLNKNLDEAIARVLSFSGEDLMTLMMDVRENLAEQGMELVILIEDFAKLQGIDHQLLEALLVRPNQDGRRLCNLRTVMAMTSGYFQRLEETVRQRIEFRVNLDTDAEEMIGSEDICKFTSRYLNAVRLSENELEEWYARALSDDLDLTRIPNACAECDFAEECHNAFGNAGEYGLYPFTETALKQMFSRVSGVIFNPRTLIKDVLRHILENYSDALANGNFPPYQLLEHFGGPQMDAIVRDDLASKDLSNTLRRQAFIELWYGGDEVVDLHPGIHNAFNLPMLGDTEVFVPTPPATPTGVNGPVEGEEELPERISTDIKQLDKWGRGEELSQDLTTTLRKLLYPAVFNRIDWDSELMLPAYFIGDNTKVFQQPSVNFERQATQWGARGKVQLGIPLEDEDLTEVVIALQGLILYNHFGHWGFPKGAKHLRYYARHLEIWANEVLNQVKSPLKTNGEWDPVPTVTEMLIIGSVMAGNLRLDSRNYHENLGGLFLEPIEVNNNRSKAWKDIVGRYQKQYNLMKGILLSRVSCTKGGSSKVKIIDAAALTGPIANVFSGDWLSEVIPDDLRSDYEPIKKMRDIFDELLEEAIQDEKSLTLAWYSNIKDNLGIETKFETVTESLRDIITEIRDEGVSPSGQSTSKVEELIEQIKPDSVDSCLEVIAELDSLGEDPQVLSLLGSIDLITMSLAEKLTDQVNSLLDNVKNRVEKDIKDFSGSQDFVSLKEEINSNLEKLMELSEELRGNV